MKSKVVIIASVIAVNLIILSEHVQGRMSNRENYLRNFYNNYEDHEKSIALLLQSRSDNANVYHKFRHDQRKIEKIKRCKRYTQIYYQNYVPASCYYTICRHNYCGYCPTSSCRRRCCTRPQVTNSTSQPPTSITTPTRITDTTVTLKECNCNKYGSKIQACDQNTGRCICKPNYEGAKCNRCKVGYWKSKSLCTPCTCNKDGSKSQNCEQDTGKCFCKLGVEGRTCDYCQSKYYGNVTTGCKVCDPCFKDGHICHPENGHCVCPHLSEGEKCDKCVANAWDYEPGIGCKSCECSVNGSLYLQCHPISGRCTCKEGFEGEKCNRCSYGYYNPLSQYLDCQRCNCNVAGTVLEDCNRGTCKCSREGCACRENVEGLRCNQCKRGTFGMDVDHPSGCINCFCSGRSSRCTASTYIWDQIRTEIVQNVIPQECVNKIICWNLPGKFTGDLISSYGGYLRISSNSPEHRIYLTGNGVTLESFTKSTGEIKFSEIYWKIKFDPNPSRLPKDCLNLLTRPCLMIVLQNVSRIQIAPTNPSTNFKIKEVLLDKISNVRGIPHAKLVENCTCPKEYSSSSCQDPNTGYYRYHPQKNELQYSHIDRVFGIARPCQCNNRSDVCDKKTGHCLNCKEFTTGPHCELCAEGYYKDSQGNCSPCRCPSEKQNFARNCSFDEITKQFLCICQPGYSGSSCSQCTDGYWGNPQDIQGTCQPCTCNPHGSEHSRCDKVTGHCRCKSDFVGETCSKCSNSRQVIQSGVCIPCDECTQILFYILDELSEGIGNSLNLFKNGLVPPWSLLNSTVHQYNLLSDRYNNVDNVKNFIRHANIPKLENRMQSIIENLSIYEKMISEQTQIIDSENAQSTNISKNIERLDKNIVDLINKVDKVDNSHTNVDEALRKARELENEITGISQEMPTTEYYQNFFDKCHAVYEQIADLGRSDLSTTRIKDQLMGLKTRVSEINRELNQIDLIDVVIRNKNKKNTDHQDRLKRIIHQISKNNSRMNENIVNLLRKINVTNVLLHDMQKINELLMNTDLERITRNLEKNGIGQIYNSLSTVRGHVKNLQNIIKNYKNFFDFTPEEWTKIGASGSYDAIVKGVENARNKAEGAKNITVDALQKLYPLGDDSLLDKANLAKAFSDRIQKRVVNLDRLTKDFKETTDDLEELKHNILSNGKSNNELNSYLRNLLLFNLSEPSNIIENLNKAKSDARNVSSLILSIQQRMQDTNISLQYELNKTYRKYLNLTSCKEIKNLNKSLNETKKHITTISSSLNFTGVIDGSKCTFETTTKDLDMIKTQINQLNSIIQDANDRAEAVEYGINIKECQRHYKLKSDIFRSLEINFKCDVCVLFNLTNSKSEILIRYKENVVHVNWKSQNISIYGNNSISIERIGAKIQVKTENDHQIITDNEPFEIENDHLLQVGNFHNNKTNDACLRKIRLNGQTVGLWKFIRSEGNCSGCYRNNTNNDGLINVFFNGNGYRKILDGDVKNLNPRETNFRFSFATFDENSLIFLAQDKTNQCSFMALNIKDGFLELNVRHVNDQHVKITSKGKYNNGVDTTVDVTMKYERQTSKQTYSLNVLVPEKEKPIRVTKKLEPKDVYKIKKSEIFVGGISSTLNRTCIAVETTSYMGNLKVQEGSLVVGNQNSISTHIEPALGSLEYCKTWFPGHGFIDLEFNNTNITEDSQIAFIFKPVHVDDSNYIMNVNGKIDIYLKKSMLTVKPIDQEELEIVPVCANSNHLILLGEKNIKVEGKIVNFTTKMNIFEKDIFQLHLGNINSSNTKYSSFVGGISDITIDNRPLPFNASTVINFANVEIGRDRVLPKKSCKNATEMQNTERYFHVSDYKTEPQAVKFGDKLHSFVFIKNIVSGKKFTLEFRFRTFYPNGLLFISNLVNKNSSSYAALEIQGGDIRLQVHGRKIKQMNVNKKINDGSWHGIHVEQIIGKRKWRLIIKLDRKWKLKERLPRNYFNGDLYLGGIASDFNVHKKWLNELHPFRGCIGSLKINKNPQIVKNNNNVVYNNIGQCFQNVEEGAYFGGDAFAIYKYDFKVNKFLELSFEFKTSELNGILLSVSNFGNSPALSVELQNGAVVMTIDMGNSIVSQVTNSLHSDATLADSRWHNITALYSSSELTVNVDGIRKSWVQSDINSMVDEIKAPLYVGGLPGSAPSGTLKIKENFHGCIRKFKIEDNIMDWTDMKELNNVQLNSCLA